MSWSKHTLQDLPRLQCTTQRNWYEHKPQLVVKTENATILWDFGIHTDSKIDANKPDITIKDYKNNSSLLIELMILKDKNLPASWRIW